LAKAFHAFKFHNPRAHLTRETLDKMCKAVDKALSLANSDKVRSRIKRVRALLRITELLWEAGGNPTPERTKKILSDINRIKKEENVSQQITQTGYKEALTEEGLKEKLSTLGITPTAQ
jgi:hypothetical protein